MNKELSANTTLSHYRIVSKLGAGGMGEVYLAEDTKLDRKVALKILPADVVADQKRMRRFVQEAKAASALNHPNIITIHEIEQIDSMNFIAIEFIDGETLRQRMRHTPIKLGEVLDIAVQCASALSAAHVTGIVHRDIKPENIMIRLDGIVKVLDFGLAKLIERIPDLVDTEAPTSFKTDPGTVVGTALYMSPEQARGTGMDARTDIFSLGIVVYEMVSDRLPFEGRSSSEVLASLLSEKEPQPLARYSTEVPIELERIVSKALRKNREERYQTIKDMLLDLQSLKQEFEFQRKLERSAPPHLKSAADTGGQTAETIRESSALLTAGERGPTSGIELNKTSVMIAVAALLIVALGVGTYLYFMRSRSGAINSIAVLPFAKASDNPDTEYLSDGISETLINDLSQISSLRVLARSTVFRYKARAADPLAVGRELGVESVLTGRLELRGDTLVVQADLMRVADGSQLWGGRFNRKLSDVLVVQEMISREIAGKLRPRLSGEDQQRLAKHHTENAEAYRLYLNGRFYWEKRTPEALNRAIEYFGQAIERDPTYALAYAGLSDTYAVLGVLHLPPKEVFPRAREAALNALRIDDTLAEAHAALGHIKVQYEYDWAGAEREYVRAIELNPNYANAHHFYALYLAMMGRFDEGLAEIRRAQELEPFSLFIHANVGAILCQAGRYDEAISQIRRVLEMNPNFDHARIVLGCAYLGKGMYEQAIAEYEKQVMTGSVFSGNLGVAYGLSGRRSEALKELDKLQELSKQRYVAPYNRAIIYAGLGDKDNALYWLEKAYEDRSTRLVWIRLDPGLDKLRSEPRFAEILRRMNLTA